MVLLGSRELAAAADERLLTHLLLRADSINRKALHWRRLKVGRCNRLALLSAVELAHCVLTG